MQFQRLLTSTCLSAEEITARTRQVYESVLRASSCLGNGNFRAIHPHDLECLFEAYDRLFFGGQCRQLLGPDRLRFRLSNRMTRAGGKTTRFVRRPGPSEPFYEIAVSTTLLFHTFHDIERPIKVTGLLCRDRLEALQRVFEHEMIHLVEMLIWTDSSCAASRFQSLATRFFGHLEHTHGLITPRERALEKFGVRAGDRVTFRFDGVQYTGVVNRITKRATVLVEDPRGERYTDGKRYAKYYVPVGMLEPLVE